MNGRRSGHPQVRGPVEGRPRDEDRRGPPPTGPSRADRRAGARTGMWLKSLMARHLRCRGDRCVATAERILPSPAAPHPFDPTTRGLPGPNLACERQGARRRLENGTIPRTPGKKCLAIAKPGLLFFGPPDLNPRVPVSGWSAEPAVLRLHTPFSLPPPPASRRGFFDPRERRRVDASGHSLETRSTGLARESVSDCHRDRTVARPLSRDSQPMEVRSMRRASSSDSSGSRRKPWRTRGITADRGGSGGAYPPRLRSFPGPNRDPCLPTAPTSSSSCSASAC